jgi:hypothetical protein
MVSRVRMGSRVDTYVAFGSGCAVVDHDALGFYIEELVLFVVFRHIGR